MGMRKETRRIELVPIVDGIVVIEYDEEDEWVESVAPYNEKFVQVIIAGVVNA